MKNLTREDAIALALIAMGLIGVGLGVEYAGWVLFLGCLAVLSVL